MMDVEIRANPRMTDDCDEDDRPLIFKLTQTQSNTEGKRSSSQNHHDGICSSNGQITGAQKATISLSKSSPVRSPLQASSWSVRRSPLASPNESSLSAKPVTGKSKIQLISDAVALPYDSDDEKPLSSRIQKNVSVIRDNQSIGLNKRPSSEAKSSGQPSVKKPKLLVNASMPTNSKSVPPAKEQLKPDDDENDHVPISQIINKSGSKSLSVEQKVIKMGSSSFLKKTNKNSKKVMKKSKSSTRFGKEIKWTNMEHNGVLLPPPYAPHGVKILYNEKPVDLTPEQEEVATMFAVLKETDYVTKPTFRENFWSDWRKILGKNHVIQNLDDCNFDPIYHWNKREKEKKQQMSTEEKKAIKEEKKKLEEKYSTAVIDGVKEKVGQFRMEPPGLFRGRGDSPKMGKLKKRIQPSDIVINIGKNAPVPECPIPGQSWKEVRHDNTVSWLACWIDPIYPKKLKNVWLAASSSFKGHIDKKKYDKARRLKDYIQDIRTAYTEGFGSKDETEKQIAVATYLIDKLALRAGNEKGDDEADTVGCCTLKVKHVEPKPPNTLKFDFLGKDSIEYKNEVEVELPVYKAFRRGKAGNDDLFDKLDTSKLNAHLKGIMPGLTAKVFRTYNASITLDEMLSRETKGEDVTQKMIVYQHANKEVAIICNHQRAISKSFPTQIEQLNKKIDKLKAHAEELQTDLSRVKKEKQPLKSADEKPARRNRETIERKISQTNAKIEKMERDKETKEVFKSVALGTSKTNYLDPRITVAWCKRHEVPIDKVFTKSLLEKFAWSMDIESSFRF